MKALGIGASDDLDDEVEEGCLVHQRRAVIARVAKRCFSQGQRFLVAVRIVWAPALSETSTVLRFTINSRPSVFTATWRLRPTIRLPPS